MSEIPIQLFNSASDLFKDQVRGGFGNRIVADILGPMSDELQALATETENTRGEIAAFENELNEKD